MDFFLNKIRFITSNGFRPNMNLVYLFKDVKFVAEILVFSTFGGMVWFTVCGTPHEWHCGGSSLPIKKLRVRWVCPIRSRLITISFFLLSSGFSHKYVLFFIMLSLVLKFLQWEFHLLFLWRLISFFTSAYVVLFMVRSVVRS